MYKLFGILIFATLISTSTSAKDGLRVVYLFDVSGSFHATTVNFATESAEEIFEAESEILDMPKPAPKKKATAKKADALPFD